MKITKKLLFLGFIIVVISYIYISSPLPFRQYPTHYITKQVNCVSCHDQEFNDLKLGKHIKTMGITQNRTLFDYVGLYTNSSDLAYKPLVASCYTCHVAYKNYNLFGLTDPYVYQAGNYAYTIGNIAVSSPIYDAQYGSVIQWPYPYSNITTLQSNSSNQTVVAALTLISAAPSNSAITSTITIQFSDYAGQQVGNSIYQYTQNLVPGDTQTLTADGKAGDYFNITIALDGTFSSLSANLMVTGTDQGTQTFDINANSAPITYKIPKDFNGANYLKTSGYYNAIRLDAIWNLWTNYPVNGNIASSDIIQTSSGTGWVNSSSCSAPDGMCHIIQKATSIGMSDGTDPDKTFFNHRMESVTSKQCRVCHLDSNLPPDSGSFALSPLQFPSSPPSGTPTPSGTPSGTPTGTPSGTPTGTPSPSPTGTPSGTPQPTSTPPSLPSNIQRVVFVAFENNGYNAVTGGGPYFDYLAKTYGDVTAYKDLEHAGFCSSTHSLPNYMAISSGTDLWNGQNKCDTDSANWGTDGSYNIFALASNSGQSYGSWAEGFNGDYSPTTSSCGSSCVVRHVPALFYSGLNSANLKDYSDWETRFLKGNEVPPSFSFITPNMCNDAHDCSVSTADNWLKNTFNLPALLQKSWASNTVFVIWFDESESESNGYLVFVSPSNLGKKHTATANPYNLLTTIEWALGLGSTGNNDDPNRYPPMTDLFG